MKKTYTKPALVNHGDVAALTQILGESSTSDFVFNSNGVVISGNNDLGSNDIQL